MKITKTQLKQIIKEELQLAEVAQLEGGPEVDIDDAIKMLEDEPDPGGTLLMVIGRLYEALEKLKSGQVGQTPSADPETLSLAADLGLDPADYPGVGQLEFEINKRMA
jgi:hypothetical protein